MRIIGAFFAVLLALGSAHADEPDPIVAGATAFYGIATGGGLTVENLLPRQRIEVSYGRFIVVGPAADLFQAAVMQPLSIDDQVTVGLRIGYQFLTYTSWSNGGDKRDNGHSFDVSIVGQLGTRNTRIGVELGPSLTVRGGTFSGGDHASLRPASSGVRVGLYGEAGFDNVGLFVNASLRTGDVVNEIKLLPLLMGGIYLRI